jgi:hypothetical protein
MTYKKNRLGVTSAKGGIYGTGDGEINFNTTIAPFQAPFVSQNEIHFLVFLKSTLVNGYTHGAFSFDFVSTFFALIPTLRDI